MRKVLQSKLNGGSSIKAINAWAVSLLRHSTPFVNWTKEEVRDMDRMTRKTMTNKSQNKVIEGARARGCEIIEQKYSNSEKEKGRSKDV